jgi:hypothetical protein
MYSEVMPSMTGGVSDGEEYGLIFGFGFGKGFVTPWIPVNGVMGMLEQVGGFFLRKFVCIFMFSHAIFIS